MDFNFLSGNSLDANNKKGNCHLAVGTLVTLKHTVTMAVYICHRKQMYKEKNIIFNGNFHFTLHSLFLQALTLMETKPV
jgi:hypothetical protein